MYGTHNSMNNLLSYCVLVEARISASEKDLPVHTSGFFYLCLRKVLWQAAKFISDLQKGEFWLSINLEFHKRTPIFQ